MSDPIYVAFATQKGGVGKSTLTALVASYLYYVEGIEVAAVDCDSTQHSLNVYREHDLMVTKENPYLKRVCRGNTDRSSKHHERIQIQFPEPRAFCGAGYRPDYRNDVLHTAFAAWLCRICLYREYAYQSCNRTCAVSAGEGRAGDVVYADVPVKGMEHEAVYQKDGEYKWYCKHSKNSGKRALLSIFRL